ncbi:hypothetical protein FJT64_022825 [Amphibalanus amphitrite]|uniref:ER-bound oxygenase mpaB/mpaB'/Rubber oxygenase catalytic domain-containing protein n=1 Tax=Amphibalanus amphitrite TaxID=1232801 RepID=A0A6A4WDY5_AMPAM|nr:hypothetical protein FJT64_022825 [Amphibalanus amphitrite]
MEVPDVVSSSPSSFSSLATAWGLLRCILSSCSSGEPRRAPPPPEAKMWAELRFSRFLAGDSEDGDVNNETPPDWLDTKKLARARELHLQYWPLMNNAQVMSLFLSFAFFENTKPLLYTGRSDTPPRARRRYLETALHVHTWALGDIWKPGDPAYRSADIVRGMHRAVGSLLDARDLSRIAHPGQLPPKVRTCGRAPAPEEGSGGGEAEEESPVEEEEESLVEVEEDEVRPSERGGFCPGPVISQRGMAATQWFFVGLIVLHPDKFGLGHLSDDDLESFVHLWRSIGHRLGVAERHNLCAGSLEQVRALMRLVERQYLVPQLERPQDDWEAMSLALYDGLGEVFSMCRYSVWRYYLLHDVLEVETADAYRSLGWRDYWRYLFLRGIYRLANQDQQIHASIRSTAKEEFKKGAEAENFSKQLMYVFDMI